MAKRNPGTLGVWGDSGTRVVASETGESGWSAPLKWDRAAKAAGERHRVFCASMADVFEDWKGPMTRRGLTLHRGKAWGSDELWIEHDLRIGRSAITINDVRERLFFLIRDTPNLDWLLLTKRPENIIPALAAIDVCDVAETFPNAWFGASVENQEAANKRIASLLQVPAAIHFLSMEPLLGSVDLTRCYSISDGSYFNAFRGEFCGMDGWASIKWVIVGGESGHGARPMNIASARSLRDQCKAAGVAFFLKQMGEKLDVENDSAMEWPRQGDEWQTIPEDYMPRFQGEKVTLRMAKKGGEMDEWPEDLRIREFPK